MQVSLVIQEISVAGNLGAIARVMANFDVKNLVLVNPQIKKTDLNAIKRAKHAQEILKNAKIVKKIPDFDYLIGTTAKLGSDYNIARVPLTAEKLAHKLSKIKSSSKKSVAIWIGREGDGLYNDELKQCDFVVSIPSSKTYPTLNISHAVGIILYELFKVKKETKRTDSFTPASKKDKDVAYNYILQALKKLDFNTKEKRETQKLLWKRVLGKAMLTRRECFALIGFFKKLK